MTKTRKVFFLWLFFLFFLSFAAISKEPKKQKIYSFKGYIKYLQSDYIFNESNSFRQFTGEALITDNLVHHRLNFSIYPVKSLTLAVEIRNRIYYGELVKVTNKYSVLTGQDFGEQLNANDDVFDMSVLIFNKRSAVWHAMLDRAYINWSKGKFDVTVGRQRINWGVSLVWNPNDIFNTYSFYDFDYEERPGSDAVRLRYFKGFASSLELAVKTVTDIDDFTGALMWKWNKKKYDFQVFGGVAKKDVVIGSAWAGNIKNAGFKGEFSYFQPYQKIVDTVGVFAGTVSFDYSFRNSLYIHGSFLYMSSGSDNASSTSLLFATNELSVKNLSPYKYSFFAQVLYPFTPIVNGGLAAIYSPAGHSLFLNPMLSVSIIENWDLDIVSQLFFSKETGDYKPLTEVVFLRLKWSY